MSSFSAGLTREQLTNAADRSRRAGWVLGFHSAIAVGLLALPVERAQVGLWVAVGAAWLTMALAALVLRVQGPSPAYRFIDACEQFTAPAALLTAIYAAEHGQPLLWLLCFLRSFAWWPRRAARAYAERLGLVLTHVGLAAAFALEAEASSALVVTAMLLVQLIDLEATGMLLGQGLEMELERDALNRELTVQSVRSDRDRVARELHDGLGADLVAMLMSLRGDEPHLSELAARVDATLAELRGVVWALRDNQGTLGELDKLLCVRIHARAPGLALRSGSALRDRLALVEASSAVPTLSAVPPLVAQLAALAGASELQLTLRATPELTVRLALGPVDATRRLTVEAALSATLEGSAERARLLESGVHLVVACAVA